MESHISVNVILVYYAKINHWFFFHRYLAKLVRDKIRIYLLNYQILLSKTTLVQFYNLVLRVRWSSALKIQKLYFVIFKVKFDFYLTVLFSSVSLLFHFSFFSRTFGFLLISFLVPWKLFSLLLAWFLMDAPELLPPPQSVASQRPRSAAIVTHRKLYCFVSGWEFCFLEIQNGCVYSSF